MWIKAIEKLPEQSGHYLCITDSEFTMVLHYDRELEAFNVHSGGVYDVSTEIAVKYWQPIEEFPGDAEDVEAYSKYF